MFAQVEGRIGVARGNFFQLFTTWQRAPRYVASILIGVPIWYVVGILITFSPEFGKALGMTPGAERRRRRVFCYLGLVGRRLRSAAGSRQCDRQPQAACSRCSSG